MIKNKQGNLKDLSLDLDSEIGAIGCDVIALNDIRELVSDLRVEMDNIEVKNARFHWNELHRSVRIIDKLCISAVDSLVTNHENAETIKHEIFKSAMDEIVQTKKA